jgi:hypothetical protein
MNLNIVEFGFLPALFMKSIIWDTTPGTSFRLVACLGYSVTLKIEIFLRNVRWLCHRTMQLYTIALSEYTSSFRCFELGTS